MRYFLTLTAAINAALLSGIAANAAVIKDQQCTHKDGSEYACSAKQLAAHEHIVACGKSWKVDKADPAVKLAGWPAYWHTCSDKLKNAAK